MHDQFLTFILCSVGYTWTESWIETTIIIAVARLVLYIEFIFYRQCQTTFLEPFGFISILVTIFTSFFEHG